MSRFNRPVTLQDAKLVENYEGELAYKLSPELELYFKATASFFHASFYTKRTEEILHAIRYIISVVPHEYTAKLAIYAREQMNLRTLPLILIVELAKIHSGDNLIAKTIYRVVKRVDEITELLGLYTKSNDRQEIKKLNKLSNQIKKGLAKCFYKFDEYQFNKYSGVRKQVKLKDALNLTHPKPLTFEQEVLFKKIANDGLTTAYTWENEFTKLGKDLWASLCEVYEFPNKHSLMEEMKLNEELRKLVFSVLNTAKKNKWEELVFSNRLPYMALIRNLRNLVKYKVSDECIAKVCTIIADKNNVLKSKQLPFRFFSAYRALNSDDLKIHYLLVNASSLTIKTKDNEEVINRLSAALEIALHHSVENLKSNLTDSLIAMDVSGSMLHPLSKNSSVMYYDIGAVLGFLLASKDTSVDLGMFGTNYLPIKFEDSDLYKSQHTDRKFEFKSGKILENVTTLYNLEGVCLYGTNGFKVLENAIEAGKMYKKIFIFTDCQMWDSEGYDYLGYRYTNEPRFSEVWKQYKSINPECKLYIFNLAQYDTVPVDFTTKDVYLISGWSDRIFDMLDAVEKGSNAIDEIKAIEI